MGQLMSDQRFHFIPSKKTSKIFDFLVLSWGIKWEHYFLKVTWKLQFMRLDAKLNELAL